MSRSFKYSIEVVNDQHSGECSFLIQSNGGFDLTFSTIVSKSLKTYNGPFSIPPNDIYTVNWHKKGTDEEFYVTIDLRSQISRDFKGFLMFKIDDNNNLTYSVSHSYKGEEIFNKKVSGKRKKIQ